MEKLIELLSEVQGNCGDNRGRDGEYLSDQVGVALELAEKILASIKEG